MDLDLYTVEREVYTALDWLGDVGGLNEGLMIIGSLIVLLFSGNGLDFLLYSHMFKVEGNTEKSNNKIEKTPNNVKLREITNRNPLDSTYRIHTCNLLCRTCKIKKINRQRMNKAK